MCRYSTDRCGLFLFFLGVQYIVGAVVTACLCAIIWARILRPRRRAQEVLFSQHACITTNNDGELCFMFRMSDIAGSHLGKRLVFCWNCCLQNDFLVQCKQWFICTWLKNGQFKTTLTNFPFVYVTCRWAKTWGVINYYFYGRL